MSDYHVDKIKRYKAIERELTTALKLAGGAPDIILNKDEWIDVLYTLAFNNIDIKATYNGPSS